MDPDNIKTDDPEHDESGLNTSGEKNTFYRYLPAFTGHHKGSREILTS